MDLDDAVIDEVDCELSAECTEQEHGAFRNENEDVARGEQLRGSIGNAVWLDYRKWIWICMEC